MRKAKMKAVQLLRKAARASHSQAMKRLVQEITMHLVGPSDQINNMIQKMMFRLMVGQKDEDDHKICVTRSCLQVKHGKKTNKRK